MTDSADNLTLPLFPLPKLVFFPKTTLPLHVFEPRYLNLVRSIVDGDQLLALPQLKPGFAADYQKEPAIYPIFGYGKLSWWEKNANGEYDILITGVGKCRLQSETLTAGNFRLATVQVLPTEANLPMGDSKNWIKRMQEQYLPLLPIYAKLSDELRGNLAQLDDAEQFCNIISMNFIADEQQRQALLECTSLTARMQLLEGCIASESLLSKPKPLHSN